ncbi:hypothetical protein AVEN_131126-1, partial [Araneus ventricosus]
VCWRNLLRSENGADSEFYSVECGNVRYTRIAEMIYQKKLERPLPLNCIILSKLEFSILNTWTFLKPINVRENSELLKNSAWII